MYLFNVIVAQIQGYHILQVAKNGITYVDNGVVGQAQVANIRDGEFFVQC